MIKLTKEQEEAIEYLKTRLSILENNKQFCTEQAIKIVLNLIQEQQKEDKKKEKMIDLMANNIVTSDSNLCQYLDMTTKCKYYAGENRKLCDECIKQYFENKAKM